MNSTPSQLKMHYGACPKKLEARHQTIIKSYRDYYCKQSLPKNKQYWSICGRCSYELGKIEDNCEPDQLMKAKLIKSNQFYGVEIDQEIFTFNQSIGKQIKWFKGDFYEQMVEYSNHNEFNPAIVNADMLLMPKCGVEYFSKIMHFLTTASKEVMLVGNFIMKARHQVATLKDIIKGLEKEPCFQDSMNSKKWTIYKQFYSYNGTGKTRTKMGTIILFKR